MANTIRIKRSTSTAAPTTLANAELAYSESSSKLFIGVGTGGAGGSASSIVAIGGTGAYATLDTAQTISGNKTFTGSVDLSSSTLTLPSVGTAGTYYKVTTDAKGRVTSGSSSLIAADIPDLSSTYLPTSGGTISSNLTISGNLTVSGTTTTVNSTTVDVADKNLTLGNVATPTNTTADGGGLTLKGATDKTFNWVNATSAWTSSENLDLATGKGYYINGTQVLNGTTLGSGVTGSSLTSVGTITSGTWNGTTITVANGGTGATTLTGLVKGNGTSAFTAAVAGTDYLSPSSDIDGGTF